MKLPAGLLALCGLALSGDLPAQHPHEHGVLRLGILVEGDRLDLRLQSPLESMAGFETAPRTEKQRQAVRRMAAILRDPQSLFVPTAAAGCVAGAVTLRADTIAPELLAAPALSAAGEPVPVSGGPAGSGAGKGSSSRRTTAPAHADLEAGFVFRCAKPPALTGLQVKLFDAFPSLRQVQVAIVTPRGDSGARLSPSRTSLTW